MNFVGLTGSTALASLLLSDLLCTNPNWGQGSSALWRTRGSRQAQEIFSEAKSTGNCTYTQGREAPVPHHSCGGFHFVPGSESQAVIYQLVEISIFNNQTTVSAHIAVLKSALHMPISDKMLLMRYSVYKFPKK